MRRTQRLLEQTSPEIILSPVVYNDLQQFAERHGARPLIQIVETKRDELMVCTITSLIASQSLST